MSVGLLIAACPKEGIAATIDFKGFPDGTILTNQYPGVTFTNAIILTAGISLNEFEFPPHSGMNVVSDDGGPITIEFASPVLSFGGYFTYLAPITLTTYDANNNVLTMTNSQFSNNLACLAGPPCSGDLGSSPNEYMSVFFARGITSVTIGTATAGASFTADDLTFETALSAAPEPPAGALFLGGFAAILSLRRTGRKT